MQVIGVDYSDTPTGATLTRRKYHLIPGHEGGSVITGLGEGVSGFREGERVVFAGAYTGTYKEIMSLPAEDLIRVPTEIDLKLATAILNQRRTAHYLTHDAQSIAVGESVLMHTAGVASGRFWCKWRSVLVLMFMRQLRPKGKRTSSGVGADEVILYTRQTSRKPLRREPPPEASKLCTTLLAAMS